MSQRFDLYSAVHKSLRNYMGATLLQLGRLDLSSEREAQACAAITRSTSARFRCYAATWQRW